MNPVFLTDKDFRPHALNSNGTFVKGDFLAILDFCLVTTCGWTIESTGTYTRIYQPNLSVGVISVRDDELDMTGATTTAGVAWFVAAESASGTTLTNQFPTTSQEAKGLATPKACNWTFIGNDKCFYFFFYQNDVPVYSNTTINSLIPYKNIVGYLSFGSFSSKRNSVYDVIVHGSSTTTYSTVTNFGYNGGSTYTVTPGMYLCRANDFTTLSSQVSVLFDGGGQNNSGSQYGLSDKSLTLTSYKIITGGKIIGKFFGKYGTRNSLSYRSQSNNGLSNYNNIITINSRNYTGVSNGTNQINYFDLTNWS